MTGKAIFRAISFVLMVLIGLVILQQVMMGGFWFFASRMDSGWSGEHREPGPVPLTSPNTRVVRLVNKRNTFETSFRELRWDEGKGPIDARERIRPLLDAIPNELTDRLGKTVLIPSRLPGGKGLADYPTYMSWGVVVSLNPDVLIISAHEMPMGNDDHPLREWDIARMSPERAKYIDSRNDHITYSLSRTPVSAGTLVPWTAEMYIVSTEPQVKNGRLEFNNNRAEITLPKGRLVLIRHDNDVDVTRE